MSGDRETCLLTAEGVLEAERGRQGRGRVCGFRVAGGGGRPAGLCLPSAWR